MVSVNWLLVLCQAILDVLFGIGKTKFVLNAHKDGIEIKLLEHVFLLMINADNMMLLEYVPLATKDIA